MKFIRKILFVVILLNLSIMVYAQRGDSIDSLLAVFSSNQQRDGDLDLLDDLLKQIDDVDSVVVYSDSAVHIGQRLRNDSLELKGLEFMSWAYNISGDYIQTAKYSYQGILFADSLGNKSSIAKFYDRLGCAYFNVKAMDNASLYYHKALNMYEQLNDSIQMTAVLRQLGQADCENGLYDIAYESYQKALDIDRKMGDKQSLANDYIIMAYADFVHYDISIKQDKDPMLLQRGMQYIDTAFYYANFKKDVFTIIDCHFVGASIMVEQARVCNDRHRKAQILDSLKVKVNRAVALCDKYGYDGVRNDFMIIEVDRYTVEENYRRAEQMLDSLNAVFSLDVDNHPIDLEAVYDRYTRLYRASRDYAKLAKYSEMYHEWYCRNHDNSYAAKSVQAMSKANFDQQMRQRELSYEMMMEKQRVEKMQFKIYVVAAIVIILMAMVLVFVLIHSYMRVRQVVKVLDFKNTELQEQHEEICAQNDNLERQREQIESQKRSLEEQNNIISAVNRQMTDSLNYASIIQTATLPSEAQMNSLFGSHLVFYRPLDIISGDFYWASQVGRYKMLAVGDCTGHGVPGAFLSMLGMSVLNEISTHQTEDDISAGRMLDEMRLAVKQALHQRGGDSDNADGMDVALVILDADKMQMHYAGAFRPAVVVRDGEVIKLEADRMPIGSHLNELEHFKDNLFELQKDDTIYLYSDGITDQFGYPDMGQHSKKFTARRFFKLLSDIAQQPFSLQYTKIEMAIDEWRFNSAVGTKCEQTDDTVVVGLRI